MSAEPIAGVILAGGSSSRMGVDKLWADLGGRPVLAWSVAAFAASGLSTLVVVTGAGGGERTRGLLADMAVAATVVTGGERRRDSAGAGLAAARDCEWMVIHDGARPFVTPELIRNGLQAA